MTTHTAREERDQLSLSCADAAKKSQKDSVDSNASLSVGMPSPRALSPIAEQQGLVVSLLQVC